MTTYKGLGISIKYGDHSRKIELRVNQHALGVRVPQGDNLRPALLRKLLSYYRVARRPCGRPALSEPDLKAGSSTQKKRPHEKRGRGLIQNETDLLDTVLLPIRTAVEIHQPCVKLHPWLTPSSFTLLHASVPQEFSS
jgi:hypothetical protein